MGGRYPDRLIYIGDLVYFIFFGRDYQGIFGKGEMDEKQAWRFFLIPSSAWVYGIFCNRFSGQQAIGKGKGRKLGMLIKVRNDTIVIIISRFSLSLFFFSPFSNPPTTMALEASPSSCIRRSFMSVYACAQNTNDRSLLWPSWRKTSEESPSNQELFP